jgi:hypothetical protein
LIETGISGVSVSLYTCADVKLSTVVTNSKGLYFFAALQPGNYYIKFTPPQGYVFSPKDAGADTLDSDVDRVTGKTDCFALAVSTADLSWDAGLYQGQLDTVVNGTVGGKVWFDDNKDGVQNDPAPDTVVAGLQVQLYACAGSLVMTTSTDTVGSYRFTNVLPGQYYLQFAAPTGYSFSPQDVTDDTLDSDVDVLTGKTVCFQVDSAEVETGWDAGLFLPTVDTVVNGRVGGQVWLDANHDGIQNDPAADEVVGSLTVELFTCAGSSLGTALTTPAGEYEFADVLPGRYYVQFTLPNGYTFSPKDVANDTLDSDPEVATGKTACFDVDSAGVDLSWDAGIWKIVSHGCTHPLAYWKWHTGSCRQRGTVGDYLPLWLGTPGGAAAINVTNTRIAINILWMKFYGGPFNGITRLYAQLLAAKLNIAAGADGSAVAHEIQAADDFLGVHGWTNWYRLSIKDRKQVLKWTTMFTLYNCGVIGPGCCGGLAGEYHESDQLEYTDYDDHDPGSGKDRPRDGR